MKKKKFLWKSIGIKGMAMMYLNALGKLVAKFTELGKMKGHCGKTKMDPTIKNADTILIFTKKETFIFITTYLSMLILYFRN